MQALINNGLDFSIKVEDNRDIKILQITDMQPVDDYQQRYIGRLTTSNTCNATKKYEKMYSYIERSVLDTNPDLIIITGDIVYGEFDDNGSNLIEFCTFMDKFAIPWAPVFGNHDNESKMGVTWQCEQFSNSKYCLFKRGNITGNGNYTIGIYNYKNQLVKVVFMMDSNGCEQAYKYFYYISNYPPYNDNEVVQTVAGFSQSQLDWIKQQSILIEKCCGKKVSKFLGCHIPPEEVCEYAYKNGYQSNGSPLNKETYVIGKDVIAKNGDFGIKGEDIGTFKTEGLFKLLKEQNFDGMFVGHVHLVNMSILCDFIRVTFGTKTSTFDSYNNVGCTIITLNNNGEEFKVKHIVYLQK